MGVATVSALSICLIIIIGLVAICWYFYDEIYDFFHPGVGIGEPCTLDTDCQGWGTAADATACCDNKCVTKVVNGAGLGKYCPGAAVGEECTAHTDCAGWGAGLTAAACCNETCRNKIGGFCPPVELGGKCTVHTDCAGWGAGTTDVACCQNVCEHKIADWAGVGYCPYACVGTAFGASGTCAQTGSE